MMQHLRLLTLFFVIAVFSRLLPHLWNITAIMSVSLLGGQALPKKWSIALILVSLFCSDILLAMIYGYPLFGFWTLFTYSGYLITTLLASFYPQTKGVKLLGGMLLLTLLYWLWTNLDAFFVMYPHTLAGLSTCYLSAIPFLRNAMLGNLIVLPILMGIVKVSRCQEQYDKQPALHQ